MTASDQNRQDWLDREWDALVRGDEVGVNPEYAALLRGLHRDDPTPGPSSAFVQALWDELDAGTRRSNVRDFRGGSGLVLVAAAVALLLISTGVLAVLVNNESAPDEGLGVVVKASATPSLEPSPSRDTPTNDAAPTDTGQPTPPASTATTVDPPATTGVTEAPSTIEPEATAPTGPPPQGQAGGPPAYTSLADYVNSVDLIVVGRISGPPSGDDPNFIYYPMAVEKIVRGAGSSDVLISGLTEGELTGDKYLLFLSGPHAGDSGLYYSIRLFVPLSDGAVVPLGYETVEYHPRAVYGGQPVEALIDEIDALPVVEDDIYALLDAYGWTPISKGYLWPQVLPERDAFDQRGPMPRRTLSWAVLLAASERVGLDFSGLAGQSVQRLPYVVERNMVDGEHVIMAEFLIVDQQIVGAWVIVLPDRFGRAYGLDEREAVLDIPVLIPTPVPAPTVPVPDGATVNPAEFYGLAQTETFRLCWPHCDMQPVTVAFRDAVVAALDVELALRPLDKHPTPPPAVEQFDATGEFVWITFGYLEPGWPTIGFYFDRENGLLLLPDNAGWVDAPPELAAVMEGVKPPPPPTKP